MNKKTMCKQDKHFVDFSPTTSHSLILEAQDSELTPIVQRLD